MLHQVTTEELFKKFHTSMNGLTYDEVAKGHLKYGKNELTQTDKKSILTLFLEEFKDLMVLILLGASIIAMIGGETIDAVIIFFIVILNACIGFLQKFKAEKALEALKKMVAPRAHVIRNNKEQIIDAIDLVPGDIVLISEGDKVTADLRIIESSELEISEAVLTGESLPVPKSSTTLKKSNPSLSELLNIAFMGTSVTHGSGRGIVVAIGMETEFGKIAKLTTSTKKDLSPLQQQIQKIGMFVGKITLVISTLLFITGITLQGKEFLEALLFSVSIAVAAVPEGLPATITIALAIGVQRMARQNAIIKQLSSVETLGSTTVICTDKTGTLTKNEMTVQEIHMDEYHADFTGVGYLPKGDIHIQGAKMKISILHDAVKKQSFEDVVHKYPKLGMVMKKLLHTAILANNAHLVEEDGRTISLGDPTEGALLTMSAKAGITLSEIGVKYKRIQEFPFDSVRKLMSIVYASPNKEIESYTKGAPEEVLQKCTHIFKDGEVRKITSADIVRFTKLNEEMATRALRVIACAYKTNLTKQSKYIQTEIESEMIFVGLTGMIDPPREEVKDAVETAKKAGIKIYVLTGDQGITAQAIAKQLGIVEQRNVKIITGVELDTLSETKLCDVLKTNKNIIFARVSPQHKLHIVNALKINGEIVAVTGDGVNDAPALKRADIGIAMGITGTDVSKEASNMILSDDKFTTIISAIREGRTIYANLKKFIYYIFSCNIGELVTVFVAILMNIPAPLTALLILCVNLGTDVLPALALGVESSEKDIMSTQPRNPKEKILTAPFMSRFIFLGTCIGITVIAVYLIQLHNYGWNFGEPLEENSLAYLKSSTTAFSLLVLIQMANTFNARSERTSLFKISIFKNPWLLTSILISITTLVILVEVPLIQKYIHTTHLETHEWVLILIASLSICVIEEFRKLCLYGWRK